MTILGNGSLDRRFRSARERALRLVPATGVLDDLVHAVGQDRCRLIRLLPFHLGAQSLTGLWVATDQADYIVYPTNASAAERTAIVSHELSHMLLLHPPAGGADQLGQLAALLAPSIDPSVVRRFFARHGYARREEADAETLATVLVTQLTRNRERSELSHDQTLDRLR